MFQAGSPNLIEAERTRSPGVLAVFYADEDDYRCRWFSELDFFDMPMGYAQEQPRPEDGPEVVTFGDLWSEGEPVVITDDHVRDWYVPRFLDAMRVTREAPDEPPHLAYEVYWNGQLIYQEELERFDDGCRREHRPGWCPDWKA